ncbi:MAG TPA: DUF5698 domain-containing protein, partial [Longimicrobiales bacterium]
MAELLAGAWGPLIIFLLRIVDVSMATVRTILIMRGHRLVAPFIGFVEVSVWVVAVGAAIGNLTSPLHVIGYAGGFAMGTFVGILIEERLALGLATVRVLSRQAGTGLAEQLREMGHRVTLFPGQGRDGPVEMLYSLVKRRELPGMLSTVANVDPDAMVAIDDARMVKR